MEKKERKRVDKYKSKRKRNREVLMVLLAGRKMWNVVM